jgi:hypothetical protein
MYTSELSTNLALTKSLAISGSLPSLLSLFVPSGMVLLQGCGSFTLVYSFWIPLTNAQKQLPSLTFSPAK